MVALQSRRLESVFGAPLGELMASHVRGLVNARVEESFDLEYKEALYGNGDAEKRDLAGDVAALANTAGGVIVIGVEEDDQARATATPGVALSDTEVGRIRNIVGSRVSPMPTFDVQSITDPDIRATKDPAKAHGYLLIMVPRSPGAPHAVLINESLRYPKRNGATIRYLSEPEVAAAYRERLAGAARQDERVRAVEYEAMARLDGGPWLLMSLVPELPGDFQITTSTFRQFQSEIKGRDVTIVHLGTTYQRARVGRRRFLADATYDNSPQASWASLELHADGSGAYGLRLHNLNDDPNTGHPVPGSSGEMVSEEQIAVGLLSGLLQMGQHARDRAAAGGNAIVRAQLAAYSAIEMGHKRVHGLTRSSSAVSLSKVPAAETVVALDALARPGSPLVAAAAALGSELGQAFGIAEMGQLSLESEIRQLYWGRDWFQLIERWARQHEIVVVDATLA